jgi:hypothetical protein
VICFYSLVHQRRSRLDAYQYLQPILEEALPRTLRTAVEPVPELREFDFVGRRWRLHARVGRRQPQTRLLPLMSVIVELLRTGENRKLSHAIRPEVPVAEIFRLPAHCRKNASPPARVIEEEKFLDEARRKLPVFAQQQRGLREAVWLARSVQPENIGFIFLCTCQRIVHRSQHKTDRRNDQQRQRQYRRIGQLPDLPSRVSRRLSESLRWSPNCPWALRSWG